MKLNVPRKSKLFTFDVVESDVLGVMHYLPLAVDESHPEVDEDVKEEEHLHGDVAGDGGLHGGGGAGAGGNPEHAESMSSWKTNSIREGSKN